MKQSRLNEWDMQTWTSMDYLALASMGVVVCLLAYMVKLALI